MGPVAVALITEGIKGLFSLFGSHAQSSAQSEATRANSAATSAALEYEKEQARRAEAARIEQANYDRTRDARADAVGDITRANRAPYVAAGQGAVTTLGELLTPGHRVNGANGVVTSPEGQRSLGDIVRERAAVVPVPVAAPAPIVPPRTSASDGAPEGFLKNKYGGLDPGGAFKSVPGLPGYYYGSDGYTMIGPDGKEVPVTPQTGPTGTPNGGGNTADTVTIKMPSGETGDVAADRVGDLVAQGGIIIKGNQSASFVPRYGRR